MAEDPTFGIELPKLGHPLPKSLSREDADRLLATVQRLKYSYAFEYRRNTALIALFLFTGLRKSEALKLRMEDVDLEHMTVNVRHGK